MGSRGIILITLWSFVILSTLLVASHEIVRAARCYSYVGELLVAMFLLTWTLVVLLLRPTRRVLAALLSSSPGALHRLAREVSTITSKP